MAATTLPRQSASEATGFGNVFDRERVRVCLEAVWEIDAMAKMLPGVVTPSVEGEHLMVRAIAGRMLRLTSMLMSGLDEPDYPTADIAKVVLLEGNAVQG